MTNLTAPAYLQGKSLVTTFNNSNTSIKNSVKIFAKSGSVSGKSIRTHRWCLNEWVYNGETLYELCDNINDRHEFTNLYHRSELSDTIANLKLLITK